MILKAEIEAEPEEATEPAETPPAFDLETDPPERSPHVEAALKSLAKIHPEWRHWHGENEPAVVRDDHGAAGELLQLQLRDALTSAETMVGDVGLEPTTR